ncbi:MAG TPA: toll/interleukin-1 receptor domain-containing protein [Ktedonobacterales bacterium]|jgi:hypothetical protein
MLGCLNIQWASTNLELDPVSSGVNLNEVLIFLNSLTWPEWIGLAAAFGGILLYLRSWCHSGVNNLIFISYRRKDIPTFAYFIGKLLAEKFGKKAIFIDEYKIKPGDVFPNKIHKALLQCGILLPVIGQGWIDMIHRLEDSEDWVGKEIAEALSRGIPSIPLMFNDDKSPSPKQLPKNLQDLAKRNALTIHEGSVDRDGKALLKDLERILPIKFKTQFWLMRLGNLSATTGLGFLILGLGALLAWGGHIPSAK